MLNYILTVLSTEGSGLPPKRVESPSSLEQKKTDWVFYTMLEKLRLKKG